MAKKKRMKKNAKAAYMEKRAALAQIVAKKKSSAAMQNKQTAPKQQDSYKTVIKKAQKDIPFEKDFIPIVFITDNGYVIPTSVAITSLICNKKPSTKYSIFILTNELNHENEKLFNTFNSKDIKLQIITVSMHELESLHTYETNTICQATPTALLKFKLPDIFNNYQKIIYLDGDILVQNDLSDLYAEDVSDYYVAAAHDTGKLYHNKEIYKQIPSYFNSGVMLLNLKKCRADNMTEKLIEEKKRNTDNSLMDQNVLNIVFCDHIKIIDIKYNFLVLNLTRASQKFNFKELNKLFNTNYKDLNDIEKQVCVLHFSSKDKPWKFYDGPYSEEWYKYFIKSPHKDSFLVRSKFVLNEFNSSQRKALIIELNPCHGECVPGYAKYFLDLGYDLSIIMNKELEADNPLADIFANKKVELKYLPQAEIVAFIKDTTKMDQYSVCLFNSSFIYKFQKLAAELLAPEKYQVKILTVDHRQELINRHAQSKSNSVVLKQFVKDNHIFEVNPHYFGANEVHNKNSLTEFVVVGGIDEKRKNHGLLISAIDELLTKGENNFHVTVVGKGSIDNLPSTIKKHITLTGRLSFPQMYEVMKKADFFLPLLDSNNPEHRRYCTTGTSGSFQLIYGFNLPCIIDADFAKIYGLTNEECISYNKGAFAAALLHAIKMDNGAYNLLQKNLSAFVKQVYQSSLAQMRNAIETHYKKEPFPIKSYFLAPYHLLKNVALKRKKEKMILSKITNMLNVSRIDIKNFGQSDNAVEVVSDNGVVSTPKYLTSAQGIGQEVICHTERQKIKIKIKNDGKLVIRFRGISRQYNGERFPIWIDYLSIKVNKEEILPSPVATWHDKPFSYEKTVKDKETLELEVISGIHKYHNDTLKTTIQKYVQYKGYINSNISEVLNMIEKKYILRKDEAAEKQDSATNLPKNISFDVNKEFFIIDSNNLNAIQTKLYGYIIQNEGIIENENITHLDKNDISGCGTYIYIEKGKNTITIKQDFNGSYGLYLFQKENYFALSNSFFYLLDYLKGKFTLEQNDDYMNYMLIQELCSEAYGDTPIKNIKLLDKDAVIQINTTTATIDIKNTDYEISQYSIDSEIGMKILDCWFEKWTKLIKRLKESTNNIKINLSGGMDSRLTFLLALKSGINLNEIMVNSIKDTLHTHAEDYKIASEIAKAFGFELNKSNFINDSINFNLEDIINIYIYNKLPFHKELKCKYQKFKHKHYSIPGAGGENLRAHWDYTIQERVEHYIRRSKRYKAKTFEKLSKSIQKIAKSSYETVKSKYNVADGGSLDIPRYLYMETRCRHHFGREAVDDYFCNSYILSPLLDPHLLKLKLTTTACSDFNLLYSLIFVRYCPQLLNFKFEGNRFLNKETIDYALKINNQYPYKPQNTDTNKKFSIITEDGSLLKEKNTNTRLNANTINNYLKGLLHADKIKVLMRESVDEDIINYAIKNSLTSTYFPLKEIYPLINIALILQSVKTTDKENHYDWLTKQQPFMDDEAQRKRELAQKMIEVSSVLTSYRIDIKNFGTESNKVEISAFDGEISEPAWYKNTQGEGKILQGNSLTNTVKIKVFNDGILRISFRGQDKSYQGKRIPVWIDYKSIKLDGKEILNAPIATWHDAPSKYEIPVKDRQEITLTFEQQHHQYTKDELKNALLKLYKNNISLEGIIQPLCAEFNKTNVCESEKK